MSFRRMPTHPAGERITLPGTEVRVVRASGAPLPIDGWAHSVPVDAKLIGVNLRTLQNWEQHRTRPAGPARALLRIVASNPKSAIEALHT